MSIFRHFNISNFQILLRALRRESPQQILQNLRRLLRSKPPKASIRNNKEAHEKNIYNQYLKREPQVSFEGDVEAILEEWVIVSPEGCEVSPDVRIELAFFLSRNDQWDIIYCDEDHLDEQGKRHSPVFKPGWSPERLLSHNYIGHPLAIRKRISNEITGDIWAFWLQALAQKWQIGHLPKILIHQISQIKTQTKTKTPQWPHSGPLVSILIPSKNNHRLLRSCINSLKKTTYQNHEILLLDNASDDPKTLAYLAELETQPNLQVHRIPNKDHNFSFSYINNQGAKAAKGELLLFLNDDTEVVSPNWLSQMVGYHSIPGVGVVGAKLLYANGTIQHVGVGVGMHTGRYQGFPIHLFESQEKDYPAYFNHAQTAVNVSAVTGACMLIARELFEELGGFDETLFPLSFNDIDLCHRVTKRGNRIVCANDIALIHKESKSRKGLSEFEETINYKRKYRGIQDPYYNPNLSGTVPFELNPLGKLDEHAKVPGIIKVGFVQNEPSHSQSLDQLKNALSLKKQWEIETLSWEQWKLTGQNRDVLVFVNLPSDMSGTPFLDLPCPAIWMLDELPEKGMPMGLEALFCIVVASKRMKTYLEKMTHEVPVEVVKKAILPEKFTSLDKMYAKALLGIPPEKHVILHHDENTGVQEAALIEKLQQRLKEVEVIRLPDDKVSLEAAYQAADVFVRTAMHSAEMSYVLQAMHAGLPIVSHADIGVGEYVVEGKNAFMVPTGDGKAMERAVRKMLSERNSFADTSSKVLELNPTFEEVLSNIEEIIINGYQSPRAFPSV